MKLKRSTFIPLCLLLYLGFMAAYFGYPSYCRGAISTTEFVLIVGITLLVIVLLHFSLKRRERLRQEREKHLRDH